MLQKVDFLPKKYKHGDFWYTLPEYETFSALVERANAWLANNPHFRVKNCETVETQILPENEKVSLEISVSTHVPYGRYHLRLLRIWVSNANCHGPPQRLGYFNVTPNSTTPGTKNEVPTFESLSSTLESFNQHWRKEHLPGSIVSIVSERQPLSKWPMKINADETLLVDGTFVKEYYLIHTIKIFYVIGPPTIPQLGMKDFAPQLVPQPKSRWKIFAAKRPVFEPVENSQHEANKWMRSQNNLKIISIHTVNYHLSPDDQKCLFSNGKQRNLEMKSDREPFEILEPLSRKHHYVRLLRIVYDRSGRSTVPALPVTSRCFLPRSVENQSKVKLNFEDQAANIARILHFFKHQSEKLISVETVQYHMRSPQVQGPCATYWNASRTNSSKVMTFFRVYFMGDTAGSKHDNGMYFDLPNVENEYESTFL